MPVRLSAALRAAPLLFLLPLFGCGPGRDQFAPACPGAGLLEHAGDIAEFRPNSSGRDLTDLMLRGRIVAIRGQCQPGDKKNALDVKVTITFEFSRGPALQGRDVAVPAFVAVTEGEQVLTKKVYGVTARFPENVDRTQFTSAPIDMSLPVGPDKSGAAYTILAGFQLTPDQLAANRARDR